MSSDPDSLVMLAWLRGRAEIACKGERPTRGRSSQVSIADERTLVEKLGRLDSKGQIAFAASCCERLLPNYRAFSIVEQWGNPAALRKALDAIWSFLDGVGLSTDEIKSLSTACMDAVPDSEEFQTIFTGLAQDASASILHVLGYMLELKLDELVQVARLPLDSIDYYLNMTCNPYVESQESNLEFDGWIEKAPMMRAEVRKQTEDLDLILTWGGSTADLIRHLRDSSRLVGIQPFTRGIVKE